MEIRHRKGIENQIANHLSILEESSHMKNEGQIRQDFSVESSKRCHGMLTL